LDSCILLLIGLSNQQGPPNKKKEIMSDEIINASDVVVSPRGRKKELIPELLTTFKALKVGQAVRLSSTFGEVSKEDRSRVSQIIRKHCRAVREDEMRIDYDTKGVPQVRIKSK
jgi:hypothetical protein